MNHIFIKKHAFHGPGALVYSQTEDNGLEYQFTAEFSTTEEAEEYCKFKNAQVSISKTRPKEEHKK